jgi:hypothetical protein
MTVYCRIEDCASEVYGLDIGLRLVYAVFR